MSPLLQLLITQAPSIIGAVRDIVSKNGAESVPTSVEVIAAFEQLFADSAARDEFLIAALKSEIAAKSGGG